MIIIKNNIIPFKGFSAINICGILFVRKGVIISKVMLNHEKIHSKQIFEMFIIPFYIFYLLEWMIRLFMKGNAYKNISFEIEAYRNQYDDNYLKNRSFKYKWIKYIKGVN